MAAGEFKIGDLVWAKMKGYPFWPARIETPPPDKSTRKGHYYVFFFGSKNYAWVLNTFIAPHSEKRVEACTTKSSAMQSAIEEIISLSKMDTKESSSPLVNEEPETEDAQTSTEESGNEGVPAPPKATFSKSRPRILRRVHKREKPARAPKKVSRKRRSEDSGLEAPSPAKVERTNDYDSDHLAEIPPETPVGDSRVAVIHPYDDDVAQRQDPDLVLPARTDNMERPPTPPIDILKVSETVSVKKVIPTTKKIGFLGLGMMGKGVVKNLMKTGHDVTVWNRTQSKCEPFVTDGAHQGLNPADVVEKCDITFCCVSDPEAVKAVIFGNCGVLVGLDRCESGSKGYVEMTSIDPTTSQEIHESIVKVGGRYLEAPVSGSRKHAEDASLLILGAGDRELFNECKSCFMSFSKNSYYLSDEVGKGSKMNLILSMLWGTACAALGEAMCLVQRCNLSPRNFLEILDLGALSCPLLLEKGRVMLSGQYTNANTTLKHQQKDMKLALSLCDDQPMSISAAANEIFKHAKLLKFSNCDVAAVVQGSRH